MPIHNGHSSQFTVIISPAAAAVARFVSKGTKSRQQPLFRSHGSILSRKAKKSGANRGILTYLIDKLDEGGPLDLDGAAVAVEEADHEVEEVGLAQVGRRLLRELHTTDVGTAKMSF